MAPGVIRDERHAPDEWLQVVYIECGWMRHLPPTAVAIIEPLLAGRRTVDDLAADMTCGRNDADGWRAPAWEPLRQWTDRALAELRRDSPAVLLDEDEDDAATVMAQEAAARRHRVARMDRYSRALGIRQVRTIGDLLDFMVAVGLLSRQGSGGTAVLELDPAAPLPGEVLPLSPAEEAQEDSMRWRALHEHTAQALILLFGPEDEHPVDSLRTTLLRLARQLGTSVESARAGALVLIDAGDFSATTSLERAVQDEVFELEVDWDRFAANRLLLRCARPGEVRP
jgi:hypothetical protein